MKNNLKKRRCLSQRDVLILKIPKERAQVGQTKDKVDRKKKKDFLIHIFRGIN